MEEQHKLLFFKVKMKDGNGGKDYQGVVGTLVALNLSLSGP